MILRGLRIEYEVDLAGRRWMCPWQTKRILDAITFRQTKGILAFVQNTASFHHISIPESEQLLEAAAEAESRRQGPTCKADDDPAMLTESMKALRKVLPLVREGQGAAEDQAHRFGQDDQVKIRLPCRHLVKNYLPLAECVTVRKKDDRLPGSRHDLVLICTYNILNARIDDFVRFDPQAIIFDESQHVKNWKSDRTKNSRNLVANAERVICISSFPLQRSPNDLISQVHMILRGLRIEYEVDPYGRRWMCPWQTKRILDAISSRQTKEFWVPSLPPKHRILHHISIPKSEQLLEAAAEAESWRQAYLQSDDDPAMLTESMKAYGKYYRLCVKAKAQYVAPYVQKLFFSPRQRQPKTLIFAFHKTVRKAIKDQLDDAKIRFVELDIPAGTTRFEGRLQKFKTDSRMNVAVLSLRASSLGLDLPEAKRIIFPELYYTVALHLQAEDRAHRFGQDDQVKIHYLADTTSIDEMILTLWEGRVKCMEERELTGIMKRFDAEVYELDLHSIPDGYDDDGDSDPDASEGEEDEDEEDDDDDDDLASEESSAAESEQSESDEDETTDDDESGPGDESPARDQYLGSDDTDDDEEQEANNRYKETTADGRYQYEDQDYVQPATDRDEEVVPRKERPPRRSARLQKSLKKASRKAKFDDDSEDDSENQDPAMQQKDSEIESEDDSNQPSTSHKHRRAVRSSDESE
ncbi:unnamed protein product, partial [Mesorhabditis spiculigera]